MLASGPLVSIGIPTYNRGRQLESIVNIAVNQTYANLQIIVVDNASTDDRACEALVNIARLNDKRIEIFKNSLNVGVLKNAEVALSKARGKYFAWFSDDDWRSPTFIETLLGELERNPEFGFAFCEYRDIVSRRIPSLSHVYPHKQLFRTFSSRSRIARLITFYFSDHAAGKCNLFYSLFITKNLRGVSLEKASLRWTDLSMDRNISLAYLANNRLLFVNKTLVALCVNNKKNYIVASGLKSTIASFCSELLFTISFASNLWSLGLIILATPFKIFNIIRFRLYIKLYRVYKNSWFLPWRMRELKARRLIEESLYENEGRKLLLSGVTLVCVATRDVEKAAAAIAISMSAISYGTSLLLSHYKPWNLLDNVKHVQIPPFNSVEEWGRFIVFELHKYIATEHVLLVHPDGFVVNPKSWSEEFLAYDYIGAPWPYPKDRYSYRSMSRRIVRVGNSVSMRSINLLKAPTELDLPWEPYHGYYHEDGFLCAQYYDLLIEKGYSYAPVEIAYKFSVETELPAQPNELTSFVFHGWMGKNKFYPRLSDY